MTNLIRSIITESISAKQAILSDPEMLQKIEASALILIDAFSRGNRVYLCGNGGSAADAQHIAAELSGPFYNRNRRALPAEALHCNSSYLTAAANDFDFGAVYARLVEGIMQPGDVLIGLSTSGTSANIVKAFETAHRKGVITIGMTGETGGNMRQTSTILLNVPSVVTPRIQEVHILLGHIICEIVETELFTES